MKLQKILGKVGFAEVFIVLLIVTQNHKLWVFTQTAKTKRSTTQYLCLTANEENIQTAILTVMQDNSLVLNSMY